MKKSNLFLAALLACGLCIPFAGCNNNPPPSDPPPSGPPSSGELTQAELSAVYAAAAESVYDKTGITNPNAPALASLTIPDETHPATTPGELFQVENNVSGMPAVLQLFSDLYANANYVMSDDAFKFSATVNVPDGPNGETRPLSQEYTIYSTVNVDAGKIYLEASVVVMGMTQYNYCDIDFDFSTNEIVSFRYLAHMADMGGIYGDVILKTDGTMYINDFQSPSSAFISALDAKKTAFEAFSANAPLLSGFDTEVQTYLNKIMSMS